MYEVDAVMEVALKVRQWAVQTVLFNQFSLPLPCLALFLGLNRSLYLLSCILKNTISIIVAVRSWKKRPWVWVVRAY